MNIEGLIRELGPVDIAALSQTILAQEEVAWHEDSYRQETYEVHRQTESIVSQTRQFVSAYSGTLL